MCGRAYSTVTEEELATRYLNKKPVKFPVLKPNYNISPTQEVLVLREDARGKRTFRHLRWGLIPFWAKDIKIGYKMINARAETITEKPSFRSAFQKRRCIIPLSGFIEWQRDGNHKRPFCIALKNEPIMSVAGIWESWQPKDDGKAEPIESFSIITTEANSFMTKIHDRMPVILDPSDEAAWLGEGSKSEEVLKLLKPCPAKWLKAYEVSPLINSPRNNNPSVLDEVSDDKPEPQEL